MNTKHKIRVLIVDDSAVARRAISEALSQDPEIEVIDVACDAYVAREKILKLQPDVITLDLEMPRMDGLETLRALKADPRTRSLPVVMMTSSREEGDLVASYALGVNSYIVEPVDFEHFAETVAQVGMYWVLANQAPPVANPAISP